MKPEGKLVAEQIAAQHCAELLHESQPAVSPLKALAGLGEKLPEILERELSGLCAGAKVKVAAKEPVEVPAGSGSEDRDKSLLFSMIAVGPREVMMAIALPQTAILSLVDIALGGSGKNCEPVEGKLPLSAKMMFGRFEKLFSCVLADSIGLPDRSQAKPRTPGVPAIENPLIGAKRNALPLQIKIGEMDPWEMTMMFPGTAATKLLSGGDEAKAAKEAGDEKLPSDPLAEPYGGIPMPMVGMLVDMTVKLSKISNLKPGTVIPVSVARNVPLLAGGKLVAHGSVGEVDDRIALQINHLIQPKEKSNAG